jgi:hypothetical protein
MTLNLTISLTFIEVKAARKSLEFPLRPLETFWKGLRVCGKLLGIDKTWLHSRTDRKKPGR